MSAPTEDIESLKPCPVKYHPENIKGLTVGQVKWWCQCGLSKNQPWCDGSHKHTGFKPLKWVVPGSNVGETSLQLFSICQCKYTQNPPYCDGRHMDLPLKIKKQQLDCLNDHTHFCTKCGFLAKE